METGRVDWGGLAGVAFVGLVVVTAGLANPLDSHKPKAEFSSYYSHFRGSSHEWRELLANFTVFLAGFCFLWFLRRLYLLLQPVDKSLALVAFGAGLVAVTLLIAAVVAVTAVGTTLAYSDDYVVDLDTAILASDVGLFLLTGAGAGAGALVWATSLAARRGSLLPRWSMWAGFVIAIACLATIASNGVALILFLLWVLALSTWCLRSSWIRTGGRRSDVQG